MKNKLISLGLNENQANVRLAVWQYGLSPASHIGKITHMERTHAYKILHQLVKKGLVNTSKRGKTTYFYIPDKTVLQSLITHQQELLLHSEQCLADLDQELDTLIDPEVSLVPPIQQRTGTQGVREGLYDCIATCRRDHIRQISFFGSKTLESMATSTETFAKKRSDFFHELATHHIHIQGYEGTGILLLETISAGLSTADIGELPTGTHALQVIIAGSHIYYLFSRREPVMLKISSPEMTELMRVLFDKSSQ